MNELDLTIRLREDTAAPEHEFRLVARDGQVAGGCTLPDPVAALAAVERFGKDIFFPQPGPRSCARSNTAGRRLQWCPGRSMAARST